MEIIMKVCHKPLSVAAIAFLFACGLNVHHAEAAIQYLNNATLNGGDAEFVQAITPIDTGDVYLVGTITLTDGGNAGLDTTSAFGFAVIDDGVNAPLFGQRWQQSLWGFEAGAVAGNSSTAIGFDTPTTLVMKLDRTANAALLWVNPNLGAAEGVNAPSVGPLVLNGTMGTYFQVRYVVSASHEDTWDFANFSVYSGGETPFATTVIPTPAALPAGLALMGIVMMRRRR